MSISVDSNFCIDSQKITIIVENTNVYINILKIILIFFPRNILIVVVPFKVH